MFDRIRKYSIDFSRSLANSRNIIFLWWKDSMPNLYAAIVTWNLCLNLLVSDSNKGESYPT